MNILNKLTIKHLKMNKKRTIVTIIGIILSTALMVGIGTLASTFIGYMIEDAKIANGSHHVALEGIENDKIKYLKNNTDIEEYATYHKIGYAELEGSTNTYKPYLYLIGGDSNYLNTSQLLDGRMPENDSEIVISAHIISNGEVNFQIGDTITLEIGKRYSDGEELDQNNPYQLEYEEIRVEYEKEYTIVGIIARRNDESYSAPGYTVITYQEPPKDGISNIFITYKKVKNVIEKTNKIIEAMELKEASTDGYENSYFIDYNDSLLAYYGESSYESINHMVMSTVAIVLTLIMVGCAIVIYNSFAISVMERKKQFGLFSSIGATKKQLRKTVFYEAFIVSLIGIPIGVLSGVFGIWVVVKIMNLLFPNMEPAIHLILIPTYIIIPIIYMIVTIVISAFIPAKRAAKISPIEAIRLNDDIKVNKKKIKTSGLTRKLFGIEGELALKNMKRNKKKYRITILSLVVSIVLFLSFSAFLEYGMKSSHSFYDVSDYDILIEFRRDENAYDDYKDVMSQLEEIDSIKDISSMYYKTKMSNDSDYGMPIQEIIMREYFSDEYYHYHNISKDEIIISEFEYGFIILPDDEYQAYLKDLKLNEAKYNGDELILIFPNIGKYMDYSNSKVYEHKWYDDSRKTLEFTFRSYRYRSIMVDHDIYLENTVSIPVTYVNKAPKLIDVNQFIISESMYPKLEELFPTVEYQGNSYEQLIPTIFIKATNATKAEKDIKDALGFKDYESNNPNYFIYNMRASEEEERNTILFISILLYGFITLVTLIGVTSVFNTINTSIALRRKEFAVLRSIGLTPKGFNKMIRYESLLYGLKALIIGIPISIGVMFLIRLSFSQVVVFGIYIPLKPMIICIVGVFVITFITMIYATSKIKKENILDAIREENI